MKHTIQCLNNPRTILEATAKDNGIIEIVIDNSGGDITCMQNIEIRIEEFKKLVKVLEAEYELEENF